MEFGPFLLLAVMEGAVGAAALTLTALGLSLVFGVMRVVNVAHGAFFMLGAVAAQMISARLGGAPWVGFLAALIAGPLAVGALAALADRLVLRRLGYEAEAVIVATIGLSYVIEQGALIGFGPDAKPVAPPFDFYIDLPWFGWSGYNLFVILAAILLTGLVFLVLGRSRAGLMMRAAQFDPETARAFGIPVARVYTLVFAAGAGLAALGAVLIAPVRQAHYLMGHDLLLMSFIVVIIGGLGSLRGTVAAAVLIGLGEGIVSMFFSPTLAKILATLLVGLVLAARPQGLLGQPGRAA